MVSKKMNGYQNIKTTMKTKYIIMSMLAALLALSSCSDDDNSTPVVKPAKAVLGEWFTQVKANGVLDGVPYDEYALLVTFQEDGHGSFL